MLCFVREGFSQKNLNKSLKEFFATYNAESVGQLQPRIVATLGSRNAQTNSSQL
jgi:hypothetical protein